MRVRWLAAVMACVAAAAAAASACGSSRRSADEMRIAWTIEPTRPVVGPATTLALTVHSASGEPLDDATVRVEGHMTHPGMTPIVVTATRQGHGRYEARFAFTMHGDWVLLVTAARPNGSRVERRIDVRDVRPPG